MAGALKNSVTAAFGASAQALHGEPFVNINSGNAQLINVCAFIVLGISNGRVQHFADNGGRLLVAELEHIQRFLDRLAANLICDQTRLLR